MGTWAIKLDLIRDWLDEQDSETAACIKMALEVLKDRGPALGRPLVDTASYSKYGNMKELRPASPGESEIRIPFAFDPARRAVMLLAGYKAKGTSRLKWSRWYRKAVPEAERLFARHLEEGEDR